MQKSLTGHALQRQLEPHFPLLQECVRHTDGTYVLDFYHPGWSTPVQPAQDTAHQITRHLSNAGIVSTYQISKTHMPDNPIVSSQVTLRLTKYAVDDPAFIPGTQRWSRILEVNADPRYTQVYYRVRLMEGMEHKWYSESELEATEAVVLAEFEKHNAALPEIKKVIPRERAIVLLAA